MIKRGLTKVMQISKIMLYNNRYGCYIFGSGKNVFSFGSKSIKDDMFQFSDGLAVKEGLKNQKYQQIIKNYIELTEQSYLQHLIAQQKNTSSHEIIHPSLILMIIPTLQKEQTIREHLLMLYPYVSLFNSKQLLLFFQYVLAYKIKTKPKIPPPKSLINCQSILVILSQLYPKQFLLEWLKQVPLYSGQNSYMVAMGAFSIISGLPEVMLQKHSTTIQRCYNRITQLFQYQDSQMRIGIIMLALQMNLTISEQLLLKSYSLLFNEIDSIKLSLLLIELDRYINYKYNHIKSIKPIDLTNEQKQQQIIDQDIIIDTGVDKIKNKSIDIKKDKKYIKFNYKEASIENIKYMLERYQLQILRYILSKQWDNVIKLHTLVKFYQLLKGKKLEGSWLKFSQRLFNYTIKKEQLAIITNLTTCQLVSMVEVLQSLKINKPQLLKGLLVVLSDRLQLASKDELIRLAKCLVTYVRLCQDYLIYFRTIIERRKLIFSFQDITKLNDIFRRVQVLFPKPLTF